MGVSSQFTKVFQKIGTVFTRLSDDEEDYLDIELAKGTSWRGRFVRKCSIKSDTEFVNGDVIQSSVDEKIYMLVGLQDDSLLNEGIYKQGELYLCNCLGEITQPIKERDRDSYEMITSFGSGEFDLHLCIVPNRLDISDRDIVPSEFESNYCYLPSSHTIENNFRITTSLPTQENYKVRTIDALSMENMLVVQLERDTR